MMKKISAFLFLMWLAFGTPAAWGQGATSKIRVAASLPSACTPGSANIAADSIVVNGVYYVCTAANTWTPLHGLEGDNTGASNTRFCGPNPWADVTCYGAHAPNGGTPVTTALCVRGNKQVVIAAPNTFQIDDGVTIYGCGATNTMGTPAGLTVTPSEPWGLTDTRSAVAGPTGNSAYEYTVVARDIYGALTAPATPLTIANGQDSLGLQKAVITKMTRTNDRVTVVTAAPNNLVVGALVEIDPKKSQQFGGWYNVAKVDSSTQFELWTTPTDTRAQGWMEGDTVSSTGGGNVAYYQENYLKWQVLPGAWEYYVCAKRPGEKALKLIGVTKPTGPHNGYTDAAFEDYGSPYMDAQVYPSYVTDAICTGTATNDPLSTWVTAIAADGVTYTLHDGPSQTASKKTIIFDDAPGFLRALNSISFFHSEHSETNSYLGGAIYIPPAAHAYVINSYLPVPKQVTIWQSGRLWLNETVSLAGSDNWFGDWSSQGVPQFGMNSGASIDPLAARPGLYLDGPGDSFRMLNIDSTNANGTVALLSDSGAGTFDLVNFGSGGGAMDYLGMTVVLRDTSGTIDPFFFHATMFYAGPDQVNDKSWTPSFWVTPNQNFRPSGIEITMDQTNFNRRGIGWGGGHSGDAGPGGVASFVSNWSYRQGGITPYFACMGCVQYAQLTFNDASQDTEGQPLEAAFLVNPNSGYLGPNITAHHPTGGAQAPLFSGLRPSFAAVDAIFSKASAFQNRDILYKTSGNLSFTYAPYATTGNYSAVVGSLYTVGMPMHGVGGYSWWFDLSVPARVAAKAAKGGGVPAGTWIYAVSAVGADGGETILSVPSPTVTTYDGTQTVNLTWSPSLGAYSYNIWRCNTVNTCVTPDEGVPTGIPAWLRVALHATGTSYTDTSAAPSSYAPPKVTGTGSTIVNATGVYASFFQPPPITVSQLPPAAAGNAGQMRRVTDSTPITAEGQTCSGNGSAAALAFSNGTVWKCF